MLLYLISTLTHLGTVACMLSSPCVLIMVVVVAVVAIPVSSEVTSIAPSSASASLRLVIVVVVVAVAEVSVLKIISSPKLSRSVTSSSCSTAVISRSV